MPETEDIKVTFGNSPPLSLTEFSQQLSLEQLHIFVDDYNRRAGSSSTFRASSNDHISSHDAIEPDDPPVSSRKDLRVVFKNTKAVSFKVDRRAMFQSTKPKSYREKLLSNRELTEIVTDPDGEKGLSFFRKDNKGKSLELVQPYQRIKNIFSAPPEIEFGYIAPMYKKSNSDINFLDECLRNNFVFSAMNSKERCMLIEAMEPVAKKKGDVLIKQGDIGDYFYVLKEGQLSYIIDDVVVGDACTGDTFGELALLYDSPRAATVKSKTSFSCFRVDRKTFRTMLAQNETQTSKDNMEILEMVPFLSHLDTPILRKISEVLTTVTVRDGEVIMRKGDKGEVFYIIRKGKVFISNIGLGDSSYDDQMLGVGHFFGEMALLTHGKRAATVTAVGDCVLWCVTRNQFEKILGKLEKLLSNTSIKHILSSIPVIQKAELKPFEIDQLVNEVEDKVFPKGQKLSTEGEKIGTDENFPQGLYYIKQGQISITCSMGQVNILKIGDYFGEVNLARNIGDKTDKTILVTEDTICRLITKKSFEDILGSIDRLGKFNSGLATKLDETITLDKLKKHEIIGAGTFGQVWLVSDNITGQSYALKIQNKKEIVRRGQLKGVLRERNLMASINHPFIVKLVNTSQCKLNIFMIMELIQGGELFNVIHTKVSDGISEFAAKFYASCVLEALSYMHRRHILYRDLKPENIIIDKSGYCRLIDLGFAKVVADNKTYTLCGTPLYIAPEILMSRGYDKSVDYWSFGVLIYEMLFGFSPFYQEDIIQIDLFKKIINVNYSFPNWVETSDASRDLISRFLVRDPVDRLGSLAGGDVDIRDHVWLRFISFDDLLSKSIKAPWLPNINDPFDTSNFENWDHLRDKQAMEEPGLLETSQILFPNF